MGQRIEVKCPCCEEMLTVDVATRQVVGHRKAPPAAKLDLAAEVTKLREAEAQRDQRFADAVAGHRKRQESLTRRFDDLFEKAQSAPDEPPGPRDIDL